MPVIIEIIENETCSYYQSFFTGRRHKNRAYPEILQNHRVKAKYAKSKRKHLKKTQLPSYHD